MRSRLALLLAIITGSALLYSSHLTAGAGDLKSLILMPGPLTQAHAKEEKQCESCHSRFDKSGQDPLCLDCHQKIAADRAENTGFHGRSPAVNRTTCKSCHSDHKGRDADIVALDKDTFNHAYTDLELLGKHSNVPCQGCHQAKSLYREASRECYQCHRKQDPHRESLGKECGTCHESSGWRKPKAFDHNSTEFSLRGKHESLQCSSCHAGEQYTFENTECVSCHRVRDVHLGGYGQNCDQCHSQSEWNNIRFDHREKTDFALTGAHREQSCQACHFSSIKKQSPSLRCDSCHRSSDIHAGRHGNECDSCHNTSRWKDSRFDHGEKTNWPLSGGHETVSCLQCHRGSLEEKVDSACGSCHGADDVHDSKRMEDCSACHQPTKWATTAVFDHELSAFPLEGMHAVASCQSCHSNLEFHQTKSACVDCHRIDDVHEAGMNQECSDCHNPNAWSLWRFDHDQRTDFKLEGAHGELACGSCHRGTGPKDVPGNCAGCHAADDRHDGKFGDNCGRCHSSETFGEVQWHN